MGIRSMVTGAARGLCTRTVFYAVDMGSLHDRREPTTEVTGTAPVVTVFAGVILLSVLPTFSVWQVGSKFISLRSFRLG